MVPYYLENHLKNIRKRKDRVTAILTSSAGNTKLDIFYYGEIIVSKGTPFITDGKFPCLIVAKDPISGEEFTVFDGAKHGYDAMFCNEYADVPSRSLVKYENTAAKSKFDCGTPLIMKKKKSATILRGIK